MNERKVKIHSEFKKVFNFVPLQRISDYEYLMLMHVQYRRNQLCDSFEGGSFSIFRIREKNLHKIKFYLTFNNSI